MGVIIALNGKGGTGKTTVAALVIEDMSRRRLGKLLAIDADPNYTLAAALGVDIDGTMVGVIEDASGSMNKLPAGMTKDRFIEMKVQESVIERDDFDLLTMGRPEGPGCYCYVNTVLRGVVNKLSKAYDYIVIDNAAGMEHISRRTERVIDKFLLVSDYSAEGVRACERIYALAKELKIKTGEAFLIVNKASGTIGPLEAQAKEAGLGLLGSIPYDEGLAEAALTGGAISGAAGEGVKHSISSIMTKVLGR